jgi:cell division protein FtsI (penicillin-binding protein 3)
MPRHDATRKVVHQSMNDIEEDISPQVKRRTRTNARYTSVSVEPSNVSPMSRSTNSRRRTPRQSEQTTQRSSKTQKADVITLHDSHKRTPRTPRTTRAAQEKAKQRHNRRPQTRTTKNKSHVVWYPKKRATILAIVLLLPFILITVRLAEIQIIDSGRYSSLGVAQRVLVRDITPERGTITDRNGNILAVSEPAFTVVADPSLIKDPEAVVNALGKVTVFDEDSVSELLSDKESRYAVVAKHVDDATRKRVVEQSIPGISVIKDNKREYPGRDVAANVIGFVGSDMNGLGGLEFMLDETLAGKKGKEVIERDPKGREIPSENRNVEKAVRGNDVCRHYRSRFAI